MKSKKSGLVYSTEHGSMCPKCGHPSTACRCARSMAGPQTKGPVRVQRSTKGRRGKGVTVITGIPLNSQELAKLAKELKKKCGSGGTVKDGVIEIQGEHRDFLVEELSSRGWTVKRSGA